MNQIAIYLLIVVLAKPTNIRQRKINISVFTQLNSNNSLMWGNHHMFIATNLSHRQYRYSLRFYD